MNASDWKFETTENGVMKVTAPLIDDAIRSTLSSLARQQEQALADALKAMGWMAPEEVQARNAIAAELQRLEPDDTDWDKTGDDYREAGWEGEDIGGYERMFFEAGFRMGRDRVLRVLRKVQP